MGQKAKTLKPWTRLDIRTLRSQAGQKPVVKIARELKRTPGAIYQRASGLGVSLRTR
jgi:hypothetical protein